MTEQVKLYGVSSGDGNNGVSHMFADYYVRTDDPWRLARLAMLAQFKPGKGMAWALEAMDVDGEAEYTIAATIYNPPDDRDEAPDDRDEAPDDEAPDDEAPDDRDDADWCSVNGAWMIIEVFPEDDPRDGRPMYDSIEDAFDKPELALAPAERD